MEQVTLAQVRRQIEVAVARRMSTNKSPIPQGMETKLAVLKILLGASQEKIADQAGIERAISWAVDHNQPVNISLVWTVCAHARSVFKITDWKYNLPRLAELWAIGWFDYLNRKIKRFYAPGIHLVITDEVPIAGLLGWREDELLLRQQVLKSLLPDFIQIVSLPNFSDLIPLETPVEQILTILTIVDNIDVELQKEISSDLYIKAQKDWNLIKRRVGDHHWNQATDIVTQMNSINENRKRCNWVGNVAFNDQPYVDGCLIRKKRWSPEIWKYALPYHGGSLLNTGAGNDEAKFSVHVVPEARLIEQGKIPYKIKISDFYDLVDSSILPWHADEQMTFFWK